MPFFSRGNKLIAACLLSSVLNVSAYQLLKRTTDVCVLTNEVYKLRNEPNANKLELELIALSKKYTSKIKRTVKKDATPLEPKIIISETFVQ